MEAQGKLSRRSGAGGLKRCPHGRPCRLGLWSARGCLLHSQGVRVVQGSSGPSNHLYLFLPRGWASIYPIGPALEKSPGNVTLGPFRLSSDSFSPTAVAPWGKPTWVPLPRLIELKGGRRPRLQLWLWQTTSCLSNIHSSFHLFTSFEGAYFEGAQGKTYFLASLKVKCNLTM